MGRELQLKYFNDTICIYGKHREMVDELWEKNKIANSFFKRLIDLYAVAAVVGLKLGERADLDNSSERRNIQLEQIAGFEQQLNTIMKMVLLLDESEGLSEQERIDRAFRKPETQEKMQEHMEIFNSYARAGIEFLHEELVVRPTSYEDVYTEPRVANIVALLNNEELMSVKE